MTTLVQIVRQAPVRLPDLSRYYRRGLPVALLTGAVALVPGGWAVATDALSEAYLSVAVFVAGTLALVAVAERGFKTDLGSWLERHRAWQVPAGAALGAFPGCGGAIVAITQYTRGYLSFGGVVATLTATMGDAMFLLLAREPTTAAGVLALGATVGIISGYVVDAIHGPAFMRPPRPAADVPQSVVERWTPDRWSLRDRIWVALTVPGLAIGLLSAFQVEVDAWTVDWAPVAPTLAIGAAGALLALAMWVVGGAEPGQRPCDAEGGCPVPGGSVVRAVVDDTNFITAWVVFAFVGYELAVSALGVDLGSVLGVWGPLVPAMAILVGMIPGCGPQILVTSLYLSGSVPLSAQLGNAIANDGDALFPALAVAPKAAMVASFYSAVPAVVVGYGWYWLVEGGAA